MELASLAQQYLPQFKACHGASTSRDQWSALNAILGCRTGQYGEILLSCRACAAPDSRHQSCGHRSCNRCQHHNTEQWLDRQKAKLLPVDYFMVTFTLPYELRSIAMANQRLVYGALLRCDTGIIKAFGLNDKELGADLAMTAVLHTHTRRLDYHPHVHLIVPGGGVTKRRNEWRQVKGKYLFNGFALAAAFRSRLLDALNKAGLSLPATPSKWVVQCQRVGRGLPALKYLSRYLYRGVISNDNILHDDGTHVTFQYKDSATGTMKTRSERGEDFIALVLQHTLPKGFRRARDYGFLHGNARRLLKTVQWILQIALPAMKEKTRPVYKCKKCHGPMMITGFRSAHSSPG